MAARYHQELFTPAVLRAQRAAYGRSQAPGPAAERDPLGRDESAFIAARDSFYLATISAGGWPYIQHRGGPAGFIRSLDAQTLAFADLRGNRQLISTGNVADHDRVSLIFMDYPGRQRLKVLGHARIVNAAADPALADRLAPPSLRAKVERLWLIDVVSFDWNCPSYITPRYTAEEVEAMVGERLPDTPAPRE